LRELAEAGGAGALASDAPPAVDEPVAAIGRPGGAIDGDPSRD
jgi:hypothetical protein